MKQQALIKMIRYSVRNKLVTGFQCLDPSEGYVKTGLQANKSSVRQPYPLAKRKEKRSQQYHCSFFSADAQSGTSSRAAVREKAQL